MAKVGPFAGFASIYRERRFWPRPISPNTKACNIAGWQRPDDEISAAELASWLTKYGHLGLGLLMGSPFPDGTTLGALDIDHDDYVRLGRALLRDPPCGRIGKRGAVFFVRVRGAPRNVAFRVAGDGDKRMVAECLFATKLCVIPPTIHPDTRRPYEWIGTPLHEVDFNELPVVEMA